MLENRLNTGSGAAVGLRTASQIGWEGNNRPGARPIKARAALPQDRHSQNTHILLPSGSGLEFPDPTPENAFVAVISPFASALRIVRSRRFIQPRIPSQPSHSHRSPANPAANPPKAMGE
ncbi:hypothetical protein DB345_02770 [Spartobacteria bacterium LR76]|nr:hypothetical protein DB345_02770 [Spartobacteria bacterium LR76]